MSPRPFALGTRELLDAVVAQVGNEDVPAAVRGHASRTIELQPNGHVVECHPNIFGGEDCR